MEMIANIFGSQCQGEKWPHPWPTIHTSLRRLFIQTFVPPWNMILYVLMSCQASSHYICHSKCYTPYTHRRTHTQLHHQQVSSFWLCTEAFWWISDAENRPWTPGHYLWPLNLGHKLQSKEDIRLLLHWKVTLKHLSQITSLSDLEDLQWEKKRRIVV